jgi:hypothetical protein
MNETLVRTTQPAAQYDDDDVLDAWLAVLTPDDLDRFLNRLSESDVAAASAFDLPA